MTHVRTVHVRVSDGDAELAADLLFGAGASAVEERAGDDGMTVLVADVSVHDASALAALRGPWAIEVVDVDAAVVHEAWRAHAEPIVAGGFVIEPAWLEPGRRAASGSTSHVIQLDPGLVFGSGSHATTRQCLLALERLVTETARVLDVGSGSGVLAIAAALLGASEVVAVDTNPEAVRVTTENAARNGVHSSVVAQATLPDEPAIFDVVVANIGAAALVELAAELQIRLAGGGTLVLSGLLEDGWEPVASAYDLEVVSTGFDDGWATLTMRRSP